MMTNSANGALDYESEFRGKKVLVTGASGVIGGWIADAFARHGANLLLSDRRIDKIDEDLKAGRWADGTVAIYGAELGNFDSMSALVDFASSFFGGPDVVVNNAGVYPHKPLLDVSLDEWQGVMDVNLNAPFFLTVECAKLMMANGVAGSVVNILSGASVTVSRNGVAYSVSKAALAMFTRGAALELAPHQIRVNGVAPGFAPGSVVSPLDDEYIATMIKSIPLGRTSGPLDSSEAVLFLSSSRASFITGATLSVDGGRTAGPVSR